MKVFFVVHHMTSPSLQTLLEVALEGTKVEGIEGVEVRVRFVLSATAVDVFEFDGFLLGTSANIGYMFGALKVFFDNVYYLMLIVKLGVLYGLYVYGNSDTMGAVCAVESIIKGMGWEWVHELVIVIGQPTKDDWEVVWDLVVMVVVIVVG